MKKQNGKHETSPAGLRAAKRDEKIASVFAGLDEVKRKAKAVAEYQLKFYREMMADKPKHPSIRVERERFEASLWAGFDKRIDDVGDYLDDHTEAMWDGWYARAQLNMRATTLFDAIKHGDEKHQAWLKEAIDAHLSGHPVPPAR